MCVISLVDSIIDGVLDADQDTIWYIVEGPTFVQDSARVFTKTVTDPNTIWEDNFACHNIPMPLIHGH